MGEKITLKIAKREVLGKKVKTLRRQGITPGVVYGAGMEAVHYEIGRASCRERV